MKFFTLFTFMIVSCYSLSFADDYLIEEMENLKKSLSHDDPDRGILSLRLADLYFDTSIQEGVGKDLVIRREKALKLYQDVLFGREGLKKPTAEKALIIKFQIARVLNKLHKIDQAKKYYLDVFSSKAVPKKVKREAAFSLAEYFEEKVIFKQADQYYLEAIKLCENVSSCNYAHYKRAWLHYKEVKIDTAIAELKLSLFESDGSVREKVLNDLLLFFSADTTNGEKELAYIESLEKKLGRDDLVKKLVEAFYSAGNRIAGTTTLMALNTKKPDIFYEARLLEEFYGYKDIDLINKYLSALEKRSKGELPLEKHEAKEFKSMLKRTLVQFDSEAQSTKKFVSPLQRLIDQFLVFYPADEMRVKLQQGWLKVENDEVRKVKRLGNWIQEDMALNLPKEHIKKLRQTRLSLAQQTKNAKVELIESLAMGDLLGQTKEAREYKYVAAHRYYKDKNFTSAKPLFLKLSVVTEKPDKWAIQSQHLLLDIYNQEKDYLKITTQANSWLENPNLAEDKALKKDLAEMKSVRTQARFEYTVSLGQTPKALAQFFDFCMQKVFEKKSCENAKVLAVKLKDQAKIVALLEKAKDERSLRYEYEAMGEFAKAAVLQEKYDLKSKSSTAIYLKLALLYELAMDQKNRDRILYRLVSKIKRAKKFEKGMEAAVYQTLDQADLLNNRTLFLPWTTSRKISLANRLSITKPSKLNRNLIVKQKNYAGSTWAKHILTEAQKNFKYQAKTKFYGRYSKSKFKRRIKRLEKAAEYAKKYLEGADSATRIYLLDMLKLAYLGLGTEILNTPLPEGLTPEILQQVQANLTQMSAPYLSLSEDYKRLQAEQFLDITDATLKADLKSNLSAENIIYADLIQDDIFEQSLIGTDVYEQIKVMAFDLKKHPYNENTLKNIEDYLMNSNQPRLASYFKGRRLNLKESSHE